jgi:nucleoside diphosphate kinase
MRVLKNNNSGMSLSETIQKTLRLVTQPDAWMSDVWVRPYIVGHRKTRHQFLMFLKPEVLDSTRGIDVGSVIDTAVQRIEEFGGTIGAIRVLSGAYMAEHKIMQAHYGVISDVYTRGADALSQQAKGCLDAHFGADIASGASVMSGAEFLQRNPVFNGTSLHILQENIGTTRLGPGMYAMKLRMLGQTIVVLNPFHAFQLIDYLNPTKAIVALEVCTDRSWLDIRRELIGTTNPADAQPQSLRKTFLSRKSELSLPNIGRSSNGVHASAGPLEAMVEIDRFFSCAAANIGLANTAFGTELRMFGISEQHIEKVAQNPNVKISDESTVSIFDATEERDDSDASLIIYLAVQENRLCE